MGQMRVKTKQGDRVRSEQKAVRAKKKKINIDRAVFTIKSTFNNTSVFVYHPRNGELLLWSSSGRSGFKGTRKGTPYAAGVTANNVAQQALDLGIKKADVFIRGIGQGREQAVRGLANSGLEIMTLKDNTPLPHNGCRPKKIRRT
jgi:small subunit ribosomal protein S11